MTGVQTCALPILKPTTISLIENTPQAIVNTLFRPYLFESKSIFILAASLENLVLLILFLTAICNFKKPSSEAMPLFFMSIFFVLILATLIGLLNPVLGSIVRYRTPLIVFYVIILILLIDKEKLKKKVFLKNSINYQ